MFFFFSSRRRHTRLVSDWSSDVCSSDLCGPTHNVRASRTGRLPPPRSAPSPSPGETIGDECAGDTRSYDDDVEIWFREVRLHDVPLTSFNDSWFGSSKSWSSCPMAGRPPSDHRRVRVDH